MQETTSPMIRGMADHAAHVINAFSFQQVNVLGWSMGGFVTRIWCAV